MESLKMSNFTFGWGTMVCVQNQSVPSNDILHHFCLTGGVHPHQSGLWPQVPWFMYQNRLGPSGGIHFPTFVPCFVVLYLNGIYSHHHSYLKTGVKFLSEFFVYCMAPETYSVRFRYSEKATEICPIFLFFISHSLLFSSVKLLQEDGPNFCGLLRISKV